VPVGSLVRVVAQEHVPGLAEVAVLVRRGGRMVPVAMRLDGPRDAGSWSSSNSDHPARVWRRPGECQRQASFLADVAQTYPQTLSAGLSRQPA
jgi:hypothetical protein